MDVAISREVGHAHVAAIRVLRYRTGRPPTLEEVAEILGSKVEITNHRLRRLAQLGIVHIVENPFDVHLSVADHAALDELPEEAREEGLSEAVEDFQKRQKKKADEMIRIFEKDDSETEQKEKHDRMAEDLKRFRKKGSTKAPWEK